MSALCANVCPINDLFKIPRYAWSQMVAPDQDGPKQSSGFAVIEPLISVRLHLTRMVKDRVSGWNYGNPLTFLRGRRQTRGTFS